MAVHVSHIIIISVGTSLQHVHIMLITWITTKQSYVLSWTCLYCSIFINKNVSDSYIHKSASVNKVEADHHVHRVWVVVINFGYWRSQAFVQNKLLKSHTIFHWPISMSRRHSCKKELNTKIKFFNQCTHEQTKL